MRHVALALVALASVSSAESLSQRDRDFTLSYLHATRKQVVDACSGLSEAQWKFKSADDKWSVAEVLEHLTIAEKELLAMAQKTIASPVPATPPEKKATDEMIMKMIPNRDQKFKAPETMVPTGRYGIGDPLLAKYKEARDTTIAYVRDVKEDLRAHFSPSPMGATDGVQWFLFISAHNERHLKQIAEIKADPKYPAK